MKHLFKITFLFCLLFLAATAGAQVSFGVRGGLINAKWDTPDEDSLLIGEGSLGSRNGLLFGAVAEIRFNEGFAIQPEVHFIQKGTKSESTFADPQIGELLSESNVIINYIEIPVMLKGGFALGPVRIDLLAGPSVGYAASGKSKFKTFLNGVLAEEGEEKLDFEDADFRRLDVGLQGGASVSFELGESLRLFVDGRYLFGLTNLNSGDEDFTVKNRGAALTGGALFEF